MPSSLLRCVCCTWRQKGSRMLPLFWLMFLPRTGMSFPHVPCLPEHSDGKLGTGESVSLKLGLFPRLTCMRLCNSRCTVFQNSGHFPKRRQHAFGHLILDPLRLPPVMGRRRP